MGRKTKLNHSVLRAVVKELIESGSYPSSAAAACGIASSTHGDWMRRGEEEPSSIFSEYRTAIKSAFEQGEHNLVRRIAKASEQSWQACAWLLERSRPSRWAKLEKRQVEQYTTAEVSLQKLVDMPESAFQEMFKDTDQILGQGISDNRFQPFMNGDNGDGNENTGREK